MTLDEWAASQTNGALLNAGEVERAVELSKQMALPLHPDRWKNWDSLVAVAHAERLAHGAPVLDAGACWDSAFLPGLQTLGFRDLTGVNLLIHETKELGGVRYEHGDITDLHQCQDSLFGFVACLSVIEHEVDWEKFLTEMARVIKPGGHLFVSFDYWPTHPYSLNARKGPAASTLQLFSAGEVVAFLAFADTVGFTPTSKVDTSVSQKVIHSPNEPPGSGGYTFFNLLLRRR